MKLNNVDGTGGEPGRDNRWEPAIQKDVLGVDRSGMELSKHWRRFFRGDKDKARGGGGEYVRFHFRLSRWGGAEIFPPLLCPRNAKPTSLTAAAQKPDRERRATARSCTFPEKPLSTR